MTNMMSLTSDQFQSHQMLFKVAKMVKGCLSKFLVYRDISSELCA